MINAVYFQLLFFSSLTKSTIERKEQREHLKSVESAADKSTSLHLKLLNLTEGKQKVTNENGMDIIQMLAKAQNQYIKSMNETEKPSNVETPKQIGHWPVDYNINSNTYIKPEPIRLMTNVSTTEVQQSQDVSPNNKSDSQKTQINPILQRLLSFPNETVNDLSNTITANPNTAVTSEMLSLDLKRKLNILNGNEASTSLTNGTSMSTSNGTGKAKNLITVKDFEENLLNESSQQQLNTMVLKNSNTCEQQPSGLMSTTKTTHQNHNHKAIDDHLSAKQPVFYLDNGYVQQRQQTHLLLNDYNEPGNNILTPLSSNDRKYYKQFSSNVIYLIFKYFFDCILLDPFTNSGKVLF